MTPNEYRDKLAAELETERPPTHGYKTFLDKSLPTETRQASLTEGVGQTAAEGEVKELCHTALDKEEDISIRAAAVQRLATEAGNDEGAVNTVLQTLADPATPEPVRKSAYHALKVLLFVSPKLREKRSEYLQVLRTVVVDPSASSDLKGAALELLARRKDGPTQELLLNALKGKAEVPVSLARTIQLLGNDIHSEVFPVLRDLLSKDSPEEDVAREAVRVLSVDPTSADFLGEVFMNSGLSEAVRRAGGIAVQSLKPQLFEKLAKVVAVDGAAPDGLRTTSVQSLERFANPVALKDDGAFKKQLKESMEKPSELMKGSLQRLQSKLGL